MFSKIKVEQHSKMKAKLWTKVYSFRSWNKSKNFNKKKVDYGLLRFN
jgi:hypothetical protein